MSGLQFLTFLMSFVSVLGVVGIVSHLCREGDRRDRLIRRVTELEQEHKDKLYYGLRDRIVANPELLGEILKDLENGD